MFVLQIVWIAILSVIIHYDNFCLFSKELSWLWKEPSSGSEKNHFGLILCRDLCHVQKLFILIFGDYIVCFAKQYCHFYFSSTIYSSLIITVNSEVC